MKYKVKRYHILIRKKKIMNDDEVAHKGRTLEVGNAEVAAVKLNCMIARTSESSKMQIFIFQELRNNFS